MAILDQLAGSQFSYAAGSSGTVTVPAGVSVTRVKCLATSDGATLTITPKGANQTSAAGDAIPIPVEGVWFDLPLLTELGPATVFAFSGTASYFVSYAKV
jgi:hypothetical protein